MRHTAQHKYRSSNLGAGSSTLSCLRFYQPSSNCYRIGHLLALMHIGRSSSGKMVSPSTRIVPLLTPTNTSSSASYAPFFAKAPTPHYLRKLARKRWTTALAVSHSYYIMMPDFPLVPNSLPPLSCAKFSPSFILSQKSTFLS